MGGLAARAWLHTHEGDERIAGVVTIGTPHHGTSLARLGYAPNAREMRRAGPWLKELGGHEPATRWTAFTCFWSHCDNIVLPASTATLAGARNVHLPGAAHVALVNRAEISTKCCAAAGLEQALELPLAGRTVPAAIVGSARTSR